MQAAHQPGIEIRDAADSAGAAAGQCRRQVRLVADENGKIVEASQQFFRVFQISGAVLDSGYDAGIACHQTRDHLMCNGNAGELRYVIEVQTEPRVRDVVDQASIARV